MKKTLLSFLLLCSLIGYYYWVEIKPEKVIKEELVEQSRLLRLPNGVQVDRLRVQSNQLSFEVEGKDDLWRIIEPVLELGDPLILGGMEKVLTLQYKERTLFDEADNLASLGLDPPEISVGVLLSHANDYRNLLIGRKIPLDENYYAKWDDEAGIFSVNENTRNAFDKTLYQIRDKSIFKISLYDKITQASVSIGDYKLVFDWDAEKQHWEMATPYPELVKTELVENYLKDLQGLHIEKFLDDESTEDPQFEPKALSGAIQIRTEKKRVLLLLLGKEFEAKYFYGATDGRTFPVLVSKAKIESLTKDPKSFIEKKIFVFEPFEIKKFSFKKGERLEAFSRQENAVFLNDSEKPFDRVLEFESFLNFLSELEYKLILNTEGIESLQLREEDNLYRFELDVERPGASKSVQLEVLSKTDGFFIRSSDDLNFYEITEENYKEMIRLMDKLLP